MQNEVRHSWYFDRTPQEVWEYLTNPQLLALWLMDNDFQPVVGHRFRFTCNTVTYCEVLEVVPFSKLSYTWQAESATDGKPFNSKVEWTLTPKEHGTELQLVHGGFTVLDDVLGHNNAWKSLGDDLAERLTSFSAKIEVFKSPADVFECLKDVSKWWGMEDLAGNTASLNDEFTVTHGDVHYSKQKLIEVVQERKIVWLVTESNLNWLQKDKQEWTNTKMIFEIIDGANKTVLHFTHQGLLPQKECYERCAQGWNMVIKDRLYGFINSAQ